MAGIARDALHAGARDGGLLQTLSPEPYLPS